MEYSVQLSREFASDVRRLKLPKTGGMGKRAWSEHFKHLPPNETIYFCDYRTEEISYRKKLLHILGRTTRLLTYRELNELIHPEDRPLVYTIEKKTLEFAGFHQISFNCQLRISYRLLHQSGRYINVTRSSFPIKPVEGRLPSTFCSILQEISHIDLHIPVQYAWIEGSAVSLNHRQYVENHFQVKMTLRQFELVSYLEKGLSYNEVAEQLHIAKATVKRHIGNLFLQTGTHSRKQLLDFVRRRNSSDKTFAIS